MCDGGEVDVGLLLALVVVVGQLDIVSPVAENGIDGGCVALILYGLEGIAGLTGPLETEAYAGFCLGAFAAHLAGDGAVEPPAESFGVGCLGVLIVGDRVLVVLNAVFDGLSIGIEQLVLHVHAVEPVGIDAASAPVEQAARP